MKRFVLLGVLGFVLVAGVGFGVWLLSLPPAPAISPPPPTASEETKATLAALRPPKRTRPLIAVIGANGETETETTDYLMPVGILRRADVADVVALATQPGTVKLFPALQAEPDATIAEFDARHPDGADYVIVPAMSRDDDPAVQAWLRAQHAKGAIIISVCAGAKVVAAAGLLDGRRATTHWYFVRRLLKDHPQVRYVRDRRYVVDGGVATTTGVTASMPMMLTLVEAIAGRDKAETVARDLGVAAWDARHASGAFKFSRPFAVNVLRNTMAFWTHERLGIRLDPGVDEVALALVADAWSRTYRSRVVAFAQAPQPVTTRGGLRIRPDEVAGAWPPRTTLPGAHERPAPALDRALAGIGARYGLGTADVVAAQLEYPSRGR